MKRFMTLMLAFPLALAIAGAAMIGVTFATVGDGGDAAPQGGDGIAETATASEERFIVGENDCWQKVIRLSRDSASELETPQSATGAETPADWSQNIRFCNFAGDITVIKTTEGISERFSVGEASCWSSSTITELGLFGVDRNATGAEAPAGWWSVEHTAGIRFCNFAGDITVITNESFSDQWIPNVLPADAIAA